MNAVSRLFTVLLLALLGGGAFAAEVIPPVPAQYFNDYANVVPPGTRQQLNQTLENFERQTSSQILVAIYPRMQSDSSIEDYTVRVAQAWKVGRQKQDNGAVLFVFVQDHKLYLQVGYGLEGALPDALCKRIIDDEITPRFRNGDFAGGLTAGVNAILAAAKGEYKGTGQTVADTRSHGFNPQLLFFLIIVGFIILSLLSPRRRRRGFFYSSGGWGSGGGWSGGGGGFSGGGFSGGGFSGGGGSFGGGGAGGSW